MEIRQKTEAWMTGKNDGIVNKSKKIRGGSGLGKEVRPGRR